MAFQESAPVCSLPTYQSFMPLAGFPPALGYCSSTAFVNNRRKSIADNLQVPPDAQCPAEVTSMCDLLSDLKASDHEFAQGVCCCIGVCLKTQSTAFVTVSVNTPTSSTTQSSPSTPSIASSTTLDATSDPFTSSSSDVSTTFASSSIPTSSVATEPEPGGTYSTSSTFASTFASSTSSSSTSSTSSSVPYTSSSVSSSSTISSTSSSSSLSSSSSTATCPTTIAASPSCSDVAVTVGLTMTYTEYYSGQYFIENTNNPGNDSPADPPIYSSIAGTLDTCSAIAACASIADPNTANTNNVYFSFDLHYLASNATWECVLYYDSSSDPSYFNVADSDACHAFGYAAPETF